MEVAGATLLHIHLHHFTPNGGVSGVAVLSESHISIHSWPEADYAALDVFMCGEAQPQKCVEVLREAFSARDVLVKTHHRGSELEDLKWQAARAKQAPVRLKGVRSGRSARLNKPRGLALPAFPGHVSALSLGDAVAIMPLRRPRIRASPS